MTSRFAAETFGMTIAEATVAAGLTCPECGAYDPSGDACSCDEVSFDVVASDGRYVGRIALRPDDWWHAYDDDESSLGRFASQVAARDCVLLAGE